MPACTGARAAVASTTTTAPTASPASRPTTRHWPAESNQPIRTRRKHIMSNTVTTQILAFISGRYPQVEITETDNIFQIGFVNSLFAMELVMFIEKTFSVTVPNDELRIENFHSAQSMTELVERLTPATVGV